MKKLLLCLGLVGLSQISLAQVALTENFEGTTFPPAGWTTIDNNPTRNWFRLSAETSTTEPISGNASAAVGYDVANSSDESLISPSFSLVGYTTAYLNFTAVTSYEWMVENPNGDIIVSVSTNGGISWTSVWNEDSEEPWEGYDPLIKRIDISNIAAGQANVQIKFNYSGQDADLAMIDDVSVTACAPISGLTLEALTSGGPSFSWTGTASGYTIEYGPVGFIQGQGQTVTTDVASYEFTTLTAGEPYSFYFRSNCGTATSGWDGPYTLAVPITSPTAVPYSFGFESYNLPAGGWASTAAATGGRWGTYAGPDELLYEGETFAGVIGTSAATNAWLFSRGLSLVGGTDITISYWIRKADLDLNGGISTNNSMTVTIGTDRTAAAQTTTVATHNNVTETEYTEKTYTYTVPADGIYYLGFHATTPAQTASTVGGLLLDAITITGTTSGTDENLAAALAVYPNPANNMINVSNAENILVNGIQIVDLNGRIVKSVKYDGVTEAQVNISDLANGMYLMTVSSDKGSMTKKIVKN